MLKKKLLLRKIEKNIKIQLLIFLLSMLFLVVGYHYVSNLIIEKMIFKMLVQEDLNIMRDINQVTKSKSSYLLEGWVFRINSENMNYRVLLDASDSDKEICAIIESSETKKNGNRSEGKRGVSEFIVSVPTKSISEEKAYEVLLYIEYEENGVEEKKKISTGRYLYQGNLFDYNPINFMLPTFGDKRMSKVITEGRLLCHDIEHTLWIYSYDGNIYWIAGEEYPFDKETHRANFFHVIPVEELHEKNSECRCGNQDFWFEEYEVQFEQKEDYRVASRKMTKCITQYIRTGIYDIERGNILSYAFIFKE